jgi:hypothetical protein
MKKFIFLLFILISTQSFSQTFKGEANIPAVDKDGFYRIFISPEVSTHLNSTLSNVRIYGSKDKEVPYLLQEEIPTQYTQVFKKYEIVEKKQQKNCCTSLVLRNPESKPINNISLSIKNAEVTKLAVLLGSDDNQNWFALKQHFTLSSIDNQNKTSEIKIVDFPLSNYTYYKLQIEDSTSAPLNILNAGYYEVNSEQGKYTEVSTFKISKSDSVVQKQSFVTIKFDTTHLIDRLAITMTGAPYFLRQASLSIKKERVNRKGKKEAYFEWLYNFELSSKQSSLIDLSGVQINDLLLTIENRDNPPLDVAAVKAYQLNRYVTAWLKKGESYKLKFGGPGLSMPDYDIEYFKDSIPKQTQVLAVGPVFIFKTESTESKTFFTSRSIIWVAIVVVVIVLGIMTLRMVNETSKSE